MSSTQVLRALSEVTNTNLKSFFLVYSDIIRDVRQNDQKTLHYLCFGEHALFVVDQKMNGHYGAGIEFSCPYKFLESCEVDKQSPELFRIRFFPNTPLTGTHVAALKRKAENPEDTEEVFWPQAITFCSPDRDKLCENLEKFFRADYMFQHWELPRSSFCVACSDSLQADWEADKLSSPHVANALTATIGSYTFEKPSQSYEAQGVSVPGKMQRYVDSSVMYNSGFAGGGGVFDSFDIYLGEMQSLDKPNFSMTYGDEKNVSEVAETYMREIGNEVIDYRITGVPEKYTRLKKRASGDKARYECWRLQMVTDRARHNTRKSKSLGNRSICIMVLQRKFIPPMMDKFQNIVVIAYGSIDRGDNFDRCRKIIDSLRPTSPKYPVDRLVVQTRMDALLLDEESYLWLALQLKIVPNESIQLLAKKFYLSIMRILKRSVSQTVENPFPEIPNSADISDDPFQYSLRLEGFVPGLVPGKKANKAVVMAWKERVWRYLAFCVDGGLARNSPNIADLCMHVLQHPRRLQRISQVLQTMLYFRASGQDHQQTALPLKIADERLMQDFTFNERVMEALLSTEYLKRILDDTTDPRVYPRFIVRLLQRGKDRLRWGYSLQYAVCRQLVRNSAKLSYSFEQEAKNKKPLKADGAMDPAATATPLSDLALHDIVPALIEVLTDRGSNEKIQVLIVSTLVNFTKNNTIVKNKVMAGGAIKHVCQFLQSKHDDLVRHSCSLLNNCTKNEQYRGQVARFGAIEALMRLLQYSKIFKYRSTRILIQACAVLGNLASDAQIRPKITTALGYENVKSAYQNYQFAQPVAIRVLVDLLDRNDTSYSKSSNELTSLQVTVIFCLKNLAIRHEENKKTIGRLAINVLLSKVLVSVKNDPKGQLLIDVTLRCLYVLSFDRGNCDIMKTGSSPIEPHLKAFQEQHRSICFHIQKNIQKVAGNTM